VAGWAHQWHLHLGVDDWAAWITAGATVFIAIGTAVLAGGVLVALWGLGDARKTRYGQLITDLSSRWDSPNMIESIMGYSAHGPDGVVNLIERLYPPPGGPAITRQDLSLYYILGRWPSLIEAIGVLHAQGAISSEVVYAMWGPGIVSAWSLWEEPVKRLRELEGYPGSFFYFEKLAGLMRIEYEKEMKNVSEAGAPATPEEAGAEADTSE
jgi:hypothetical protein